MTDKAFFIEFQYDNKLELAEIKPCCQEDNVYYYDVFIKNAYQFTITPIFSAEQGLEWKISLKNADKKVTDAMVKAIGEQIERRILSEGQMPEVDN